MMQNHENQISNLLYTYTHRFDAGDFEGAAALFRHASINTRGRDAPIDYLELLETWRSMVIVYEDTGTPKTKHMCTNAIINVDEDALHASAESYYMVLQQTEQLPLQPIVAGRYHDKFERVDGVWRFSHRDYSLMDLPGNLKAHLRGIDKLLAER